VRFHCTTCINNLKARFNTAAAITSTLSSTGTDSFAVGGTLNIGATQIPGVYTGTFDVTVDYLGINHYISEGCAMQVHSSFFLYFRLIINIPTNV
jgi:hypothetical protein